MLNNKNTPLDPLKVHLIIRNKDRIFFDEDIKAITSLNDKGKFDILPQHANFITLIQEYIIIYRLDGSTKKVEFDNGVLKVRENLINCYVDIIPIVGGIGKPRPTSIKIQ